MSMAHGVAPAAPRRSWAFDVAIASALTFVIVMATLNIDAERAERPSDWFAVMLAVVAASSTVLRRRLPIVTLVAVGGALAVYAAMDYPGGPIFALGPIALFSFMIGVSRREAWIAAGAIGVAMVVARMLAGNGLDAITLLWVGWVVAATLGSEVARSRIEQRRIAETRRHEQEAHEAEQSRRQVVEERLRIARDLHDSVAHSMATINVQAGVAAHVIDRRPLDARDALEVIRATSGTVLDELAAMVTLLRADATASDGDASAPRQPAPDLTRLETLVTSSRLAGLDVDVVVGDVQLEHVAPTISTSAYRIIQEALTNVVRHAGASAATVAVLRPPGGGLAVEVADQGAAAPAGPPEAGSGSGMGLVGIRERAEATGGHAEAGPRPGGGFLVRAQWP